MTRFRLSGNPARLLLAAAPPDAIAVVDVDVDAEQGAWGRVLQMLPNGATAAFMPMPLPMPMPMPPTDVVGEVAPLPATAGAATPRSSSWASMVGKC